MGVVFLFVKQRSVAEQRNNMENIALQNGVLIHCIIMKIIAARRAIIYGRPSLFKKSEDFFGSIKVLSIFVYELITTKFTTMQNDFGSHLSQILDRLVPYESIPSWFCDQHAVDAADFADVFAGEYGFEHGVLSAPSSYGFQMYIRIVWHITQLDIIGNAIRKYYSTLKLNEDETQEK